MKKILLAEDHSIVIYGMKIIFETEFPGYILEFTKTISGLMKILRNNHYALAILDLQLQDGDTMHLISNIRRLYPELPILVFSANPEELYAQRLFKEGIKGYLHKQTEDKDIILALRLLLSGKIYMSEKFKQYLLMKNENMNFDNPFDKLSQREMEVANLLIQGRRSIEICRELNIQASTVATYKMKILTKLNIANVFELKALASNFNIKQ